jgi:hypothetical protein
MNNPFICTIKLVLALIELVLGIALCIAGFVYSFFHDLISWSFKDGTCITGFRA